MSSVIKKFAPIANDIEARPKLRDRFKKIRDGYNVKVEDTEADV